MMKKKGCGHVSVLVDRKTVVTDAMCVPCLNARIAELEERLEHLECATCAGRGTIFSSHSMKDEQCPECEDRELALKARIAELEQICQQQLQRLNDRTDHEASLDRRIVELERQLNEEHAMRVGDVEELGRRAQELERENERLRDQAEEFANNANLAVRRVTLGLMKKRHLETVAREALDFYWPLDEHGEPTITPDREEPYWGARADRLRALLGEKQDG